MAGERWFCGEAEAVGRAAATVAVPFERCILIDFILSNDGASSSGEETMKDAIIGAAALAVLISGVVIWEKMSNTTQKAAKVVFGLTAGGLCAWAGFSFGGVGGGMVTGLGLFLIIGSFAMIIAASS